MKKIISILLALAICLSLLSTFAFAALQFTDVKTTAWYYKAVQWAVEKNITSGTTPTTFSPSTICTRAQAVTFLWNANGKPNPTITKNPFTDVKATAWYYKAVLWAVEKNITSGTTPTTFAPDAKCDRSQIVTFLWNSQSKVEPTSSKNPFTDVSSKAWYYKAVLWAVEKGITKGTTATTFAPSTKCDRAQIVTFLYNFFKNNTSSTPAPCEHKYDNACDKLCNVCNAERTVEPHKYDNACDKDCNVCNAERTVPAHVYDNACDKLCNVCNAERTVEPHKYDNACDKDCNVCGEVRTPAAHVYTNACDKDCNVCFATRTVPAHVYDNDYDADCNVCGETRPIPPTIVNQPTDVTVKIGDIAVFTVVAEGGTGAYTYKWQFMSNMQPSWIDITNNYPFSGANTADLTVEIYSDHYNDCYKFRCIITDEAGKSVTSAEASVFEFVPIMIYEEPTDVYAVAGDRASFHVGVTGGKPTYTYEWYLKYNYDSPIRINGTDFDAHGYNTDTLNITITEDMLYYNSYIYCIIEDQYGDNAYSERAYILRELTLDSYTSDQYVQLGDMVDLEVQVSGGKKPYSYQWQRRFGSNGDFTNYSTGTKLREEVNTTMLDMYVDYRCVVTDAAGNTVQTAPIKLIGYQDLQIVSQPTKATNVSLGDDVTFSVGVTGGAGKLTYQWQFRTTSNLTFNKINNATQSSYTFEVTETQRKFDVRLRCVITDEKGNSVTTNEVDMDYALYVVSISKTQTYVANDDPFFIEVVVDGGTGNYTYSWELYSVRAPSNGWRPNLNDYKSWIFSYQTAKLEGKGWYMGVYKFRCKISDGVTTIYSDEVTINGPTGLY